MPRYKVGLVAAGAWQGQEGPPGQQKDYFFCCPKGYLNLCDRDGFKVCSSRPCDQLPGVSD